MNDTTQRSGSTLLSTSAARRVALIRFRGLTLRAHSYSLLKLCVWILRCARSAAVDALQRPHSDHLMRESCEISKRLHPHARDTRTSSLDPMSIFSRGQIPSAMRMRACLWWRISMTRSGSVGSDSRLHRGKPRLDSLQQPCGYHIILADRRQFTVRKTTDPQQMTQTCTTTGEVSHRP